MNEATLACLYISFFVIILYELHARSASIVLWGGLFIFFAIPHGIDVLHESKNYIESTYLIATIFALSFNAIYLLSRILLKNIKIRTPKWLIISSGPHIASRYTSILFFSLAASVVLLLMHIHTTFGSFTNFTWIDLFDNRQSFYYIASSYLLTFSAPLVYVSIIHKKYRLTLIAMMLLVVVLILSRVRANAIAMFIPLIVFYLYSGGTYTKILKRLAVTSIFSLLFITIVLGFGAIRIFGDYSQAIGLKEIIQTTIDLISSPHSEFGLRNAFYHFIENDNNFEGFNSGLGYIRLFLMPIPSSLLFELKPIDFASYMAIAYAPDYSILGVNSMHPTLYGDLFGNFYYFGVFLGIFWAVIVKMLDLLYLHQHRNVFAASIFVSVVYSLTLVARGAIYNGLFNVYFIIAINWIVSFIMIIKFRFTKSWAHD
jgi:hypothetical protein